jgi:hypothetical protein
MDINKVVALFVEEVISSSIPSFFSAGEFLM